MGPASLFVTAASRATRRVVSSHSSTAASCSGYRARVVQNGGSILAPLRSGNEYRAASSASRSRRSFRGGVAAHATEAEEASVSDIDIGEDNYPRVPPSVHSLQGNLAILQGVGGDVQPGTLLKLGTSGVTGRAATPLPGVTALATWTARHQPVSLTMRHTRVCSHSRGVSQIVLYFETYCLSSIEPCFDTRKLPCDECEPWLRGSCCRTASPSPSRCCTPTARWGRTR
jgi:hypothetical protein